MLVHFYKKYIKSNTAKYFMLFTLVFILNAMFAIRMRGPMFSDEIGHLSSVEYLVGNDWSDYVKNVGLGYYKYGTAILYFPLYLLIQDRTFLYISMLLFNSIILALIPCIIFKIEIDFLNIKDDRKAMLIAFMLGVMPSSLILSKTVLSETLLSFLSWLILLFLLICFHCGKNWERHILSITIGFLSVYAYITHARGIVVTILLFMLVFLLRYWKKISVINIPSYLLGIFIGWSVDSVLGNFLKSHIWNGNINYNSTQEILSGWAHIDFFFSGLKTIVYTLFGWLYSTCSSSYGLAIWGIVFVVIFLYKYFKAGKETEKIKEDEVIIYIYTILYFVGGFALGIIFMGLGTYRIIYHGEMLRLDQIIYVRYVMVPIQLLTFIAAYQLTEKDYLKKYKNTSIKAIVLINFIFFFFISDFLHEGTAAILQLCGLPIIPSQSHDILVNSSNIYRQMLVWSILNIVIALFIYIVGKRKILIFITSIAVLFIVQYFIWMHNVCLPISEYYYDKIDVAESFCDEYDIETETNIIIEGDRIVYPAQYKLYKYNVQRTDCEELDNALIFVADIKNSEFSTSGIYYEITNNDNYSSYIVVKGDNLKDCLIAKGLNLKEIRNY
ncbi:hypothetical protein [Mediterraneibacter agrestimuris]|uniref:hypothetical protein n=1 Tax=Mediterraneibacter agrestimuris TaxID=2941333 RepID=UPI00203C4C72|nr:hypothetical protein [Mediterraneibacter agrestimuris]